MSYLYMHDLGPPPVCFVNVLVKTKPQINLKRGNINVYCMVVDASNQLKTSFNISNFRERCTWQEHFCFE